jgi:TonB family protein
LKGYKVIVSAFFTFVLFNGYARTQGEVISDNNDVVTYQSHCVTYEKSSNQEPVDEKGMGKDFLLSSKPPVYPYKAAVNGIEGYVKLEFDISSEGKPININIIESYPSTLFNSAAKESLSEWRYKPQANTCFSITLDFRMG